MKLFWLLGHFGLADPDKTPGYSSDGYQIAEPISIVSTRELGSGISSKCSHCL